MSEIVTANEDSDSAPQKRIFLLVVGILVGVFLLSVIWEFVLEEITLKFVGFGDIGESTEEQWRYVAAIVSFVGFSLITFALLFNYIHEKHKTDDNAKKYGDGKQGSRHLYVTLPIGLFGLSMVGLLLFLSNLGTRMTESRPAP